MICAAPMRHKITLLGAGFIGAVVVGCILPDTIRATDENRNNRHPVRIVEPMALTPEAEAACDPTNGCPQPEPLPSTVLPKFLNPDLLDYQFCSCPEGQEDRLAQNTFMVHIEDRDGEETQVYDTIYAALLLDYDPSKPVTEQRMRYQSYVDPQSALPPPIPSYSPQNEPPIGRPDPLVRRLYFGNSTTPFDFCNGSGQGPLSVGYHTLTLLVTDRDWFSSMPFAADTDTDTDTDADTDGSNYVVTQEGVPDLANGASFDTLTFVFYCHDHADETDGVSCSCEDPNEDEE